MSPSFLILRNGGPQVHRPLIGRRKTPGVRNQDTAALVENRCSHDAALARAPVDEGGQLPRIVHQFQRLTVDVRAQIADVGAQRDDMLIDVFFGDIDRFAQRSGDTAAEPGLDAEFEHRGRKHGDDNRRRHRDEAEEQNQTSVEPRSGLALPPCRPKENDAKGDQPGKRQDDHQIDDNERQVDAGIGAERRFGQIDRGQYDS